MAEIITKATRVSFGEALCEMAESRPDIIVLDADLAAATNTSIFRNAYPERFFDCGIAEGNMIGVAAGLAACGELYSNFLGHGIGRHDGIDCCRIAVLGKALRQ